nr:PREDICTED: zinc finger protein 638 [Opisthocomus hoazin]
MVSDSHVPASYQKRNGGFRRRRGFLENACSGLQSVCPPARDTAGGAGGSEDSWGSPCRCCGFGARSWAAEAPAGRYENAFPERAGVAVVGSVSTALPYSAVFVRFAPLVNSLNLGIASPLLLGPPPLQLAQIKTQLALQQLTSVATTGSAPPYAWLNQAFLKSAMFSPRGTLPPRPRGPNPSGTKPPGSCRGGGAGGPPRKPAPGTPQGTPQRCSGPETLQWTGSQRINVRVTLHRPDPRQVKGKANLHQEQKVEPRTSHWDSSPCSAGPAGQKPSSSARISEQNSNAQNRYTPESASSILASFGLSNEDLEELSRYPDDQLTPENMPLILREIRIRKMGHSVAGLHAQSRGEDTMGGASGAAVKSKVIDYGHASKYGYTEDPLEVRAYNPKVLTEEPLEARVYNPEAPSGENREDFQREQNVSMGVPPAGVPCNPVFPVEEMMKPTGFQNDSSNAQAFFPPEATGKVSGLCAAPAALPVGKPVSQPAMPPVMPPMMPPMMPPLAQPLMPPIMLPVVQQPVAQHVMPPITHPPFSPGLLAAISHHERGHREAGPSPPNAQSGSGAAGQKPFQTQAEGPIKSPFGVVKASWLPAFLQPDPQKIKRLPTPSMMNDYYATSPRIFPHMCSLCNIECTYMKDWILHQNTAPHIESCRQLRQQYPDWNPESHSSKRNAGDRKENQTPRRRSNSASPSPRRSRFTGSGYALRRSRSRSRSPGRFRSTRPRSRSPRQMRRLSPRHRSRSPQRSRNPLRTSSRPQRSSSNDWASRRSTRSQGSSSPETDDAPEGKEVEEEEEDLPAGTSGPCPPYNRLLREDLLSCGTVLQISDLPDDGFSDQDIKKIVQPFGKVSDLLVFRSRNEAFLEMNYKEAVIAAVEYGETVPVLLNGKRGKISVAEKPKASPGQAKINVKKRTQNVKKAASSTKKEQNTKTTKSLTGKKEKTKKSTVTGDGKIKKASNTAAKPIEEDLQSSVEAETEVGAAALSDPKDVTEGDGATEPVEAQPRGETSPAPAPGTSEATTATAKSEEAAEAAGRDLDDLCVVLISNLPEKGCSAEEVSNLAKPFGGLRDVLIVSSHQKAYLEINRKSADSMVKFYTCFPISLDGNQLCINMVPQYKTVKDEEAIFTAIIKDSDPKVNTETVHHQFVHLGNLPDDGYRELEVVCVGLRFGKVDHYVVLKNKNKAILQLDSPKAARSMHSFLQQYPYSMGERTLTCTLSPAGEAAEAEVVKKEAQTEEPSKGRYGLGVEKALCDVSEVFTERIPATERGAEPPRGEKAPSGIPPRVTEVKPALSAGAAVERKLDAAGEMKAAESALRAGGAAEEDSEKLAVKTGAETEKKLEKFVAGVEAAVGSAANAVSENDEGGLIKAHQAKGPGPAKPDETCRAVALGSSLSVAELSSVGKIILKAVVSLPDIAKSRALAQRVEPALWKAGEQKAPSKPEARGQAAVEKKTAPKDEDHLRPGCSQPSLGDGSGKCRVSRASAVDGRGGSGRNPSQQEKDSRVESRASSKQSQEGESRSPSVKKDPGSDKAPVGGNAKTSKSDAGGSAKEVRIELEDEELFPFNLDEFVTVDEVVEEIKSPVKTRRNPLRGKRKEGAKSPSSSEPGSKRRKEKSSVACIAESELSFVTLDEIGEEEDVTAHDPQGLVVVDEVTEEEELMSEAVKDPQSLVTLDELSEQEELASQKDVPRSVFEEQDLKAEPLVTVDEIGVAEELPLNEPTGLSVKEEEKEAVEDAREFGSSQVPDDPSALVTVDELPEDNEDNPLVTLDEVNEDEDDFLADYNRMKEDLNFVTVDEVGEEDEEEENTFPGKNLDEGEDDEDIVAVAGPEEENAAGAGPEEEDIVAGAGAEEMEILGDTSPEEEMAALSKSKGLDYLVPKAGFFCQICSLFYADEIAVKNHCRTLLHQQNMEKFMAKQAEEETDGEEPSSR